MPDLASDRKNQTSHGVSFITAAEVFEDPDPGENYFVEESRYSTGITHPSLIQPRPCDQPRFPALCDEVCMCSSIGRSKESSSAVHLSDQVAAVLERITC